MSLGRIPHFPPPVQSSPAIVQCGKCGFGYDPTGVPGGLCPRCLLLGAHDTRAGSHHAIVSEEEPVAVLAEDELAAELPGFDLVESLGRGGMGMVWKATERVLNRHVAIKLLHNLKKDMDFVERFAREARVMAQLSHPNIVTLFSFGRTRSNHCYLVMEMVEGTDLGGVLAKGVPDLPVALQITCDVCAALRHAHDSGYMHRDIKPGNVLIDGRGRVKVADFGLARLTDDLDTTSITRHGIAVGTPHYIAPEQARGDGREDHRADIYSVGVMLYQMLTGELPRGVFSPPSEKRHLDKRLDNVVFRALQEVPERRYQSVAELVADLQAVRSSIDPGLRAQQQAASRKRRREMVLAIAVSLVLGVMLASYVRDRQQPTVKNPVARTAPAHDGGVSVTAAAGLPQAPAVNVKREIRLQPPGLSSGSLFGRSLSASGDWLAIGAPDDKSQAPSDPGCVYLYRRDPASGWSLQQVLANPHHGGGLRFGHDVALEGTRLLVNATRKSGGAKGNGTLDAFELPPQSTKWQPAPNATPPPAAAAHLGHSVALTADFVAVGAPVSSGAGSAAEETGTGAVIIYEFARPLW